MNNIEHLIRLANRIGAFFEAMPDRAEGLEGIANHIQKFWEPRMRAALLNFLESSPDGKAAGAALSDIARTAILQNKERLRPRAQA
ncbi:formate dehydrogenase subunit delta [Parapusillimonas granuli]|uniref:Formate dehydrogenase subunit delta n=1 Tax=Parapusillimonas granuli TaxID=380911 RepID=A0A853G3D6_9BURK|nr:formate dehydrogenase subunit delta [Parapusillimonas granuli]MBB5215203.1 formate dehydrogenase subunit delta [Parapusillimonas granuli]MEB2401791.1 formate dehydrogenase subunit delta [Alcaligenaceae bacterium]NYT49520.1 formate dehydrogenase subunit delta [Parapusillimonas granuli]